jgi:hypothetical protein
MFEQSDFASLLKSAAPNNYRELLSCLGHLLPETSSDSHYLTFPASALDAIKELADWRVFECSRPEGVSEARTFPQDVCFTHFLIGLRPPPEKRNEENSAGGGGTDFGPVGRPMLLIIYAPVEAAI